jgi:hypothetical protein
MRAATAFMLGGSVPAGSSRSTILGRGKRLAARTTADGIGVVNRKSAPHQLIHKVNLASLEVLRAELIDIERDSLSAFHQIALELLVLETHAVLETRAPAGSDKYSKADIGHALLIHQTTQLAQGLVGHIDHSLSSVGPCKQPILA